jgi:O-antigen ligase
LLTFFAPLVAYLLSWPVMLATVARVEIGIVYFITLVPLIAVMKKMAEFPQGHNFGDFLIVAICVGWIFRRARERRGLFDRSPLNIVVILLIFGSILNLIRGLTFLPLSDEVQVTRLLTWKNFMILPVLYFVGANNIKSDRFVQAIIGCVCLTLIVADFNFYTTFKWMNTEHYSDNIRISGPFSYLGPNEMGVFFSQHVFLLLGILYYTENRKLKYLILVCCSASMYPILFSYSRAAYMCTLTGLFFIGIIKDKRFLLLLLVLVILYSVVLPRSVVERIDMTFVGSEEVSEARNEAGVFDVGGTKIEMTGRKHLWVSALKYFEAEPLLGIGFDTFRHLEGFITHSLYMKILAEQGIVGSLIFLVFIVTVLRQSYVLFSKSKSKLRKGVGLGFMACVVVNLVGGIAGDQSLYYNFMCIYWLFMGIVASFNNALSEEEVSVQKVSCSASEEPSSSAIAVKSASY